MEKKYKQLNHYFFRCIFAYAGSVYVRNIMWFNLPVVVLRFHDESDESLGFNVYSRYLVKKQERSQKRQSLLFIESSTESKHRKRFWPKMLIRAAYCKKYDWRTMSRTASICIYLFPLILLSLKLKSYLEMILTVIAYLKKFRWKRPNIIRLVAPVSDQIFALFFTVLLCQILRVPLTLCNLNGIVGHN